MAGHKTTGRAQAAGAQGGGNPVGDGARTPDGGKRAERSKRKRKTIARFIVDGARVTAWIEGGVLRFRRHRRRRVEMLSLQDAWHRAVGQLELFHPS